MDVIQSLSLIALLSMLIYLVFVNIFATKTVQSSGSVIDLLPTPGLGAATSTSTSPTSIFSTASTTAPHAPSAPHAPCPFPMPAGLSSRLSNKLPESGPDASVHPQSSIFSSTASSTSGINAQNQDIYEKQADFGSDVTNIKQFYKNNPDVFSKILCPPTVTNVADWERQSKELYDSAQSAQAGPIQAANFESNFMSSL